MIKRLFCFLAVLSTAVSTYGQDPAAVPADSVAAAPEDTLGWRRSGQLGLNFSQVHLSNWVAGGQSSLSLLSLGSYKMEHVGLKHRWENYIDLAYGILRAQEDYVVKTDDRIELGSKYGKHAFDDFFYTASANFRTQFAPGYNYPNDSVRISEFMAPGYLLVAIGLDYKPNDYFSIFLSPITGKFTFVMDTALSNAGAYGVEPAEYQDGMLISEGEMMREELGAYLKATLEKKLAENITLKSRVELFSNYLNNPGNIDINWETALLMKVNKYISTNIATHLVYDDDIHVPFDDNSDGVTDRSGPRVQFKELLSVGLLYQF